MRTLIGITGASGSAFGADFVMGHLGTLRFDALRLRIVGISQSEVCASQIRVSEICTLEISSKKVYAP